MALAICVFMTWCVIIVHSLMPKKLSGAEMVFIYFCSTVFELSIFTIVHLNLGWIEVDKGVEKSIADLVLRLFTNPLIFIISTNILLYRWKVLKWVIIAAIVLAFIPMGYMLERIGIISTPHWNAWLTVAMFTSYVIFSRLMAWIIISTGQKEANAQ
ncbi:hypothetical protein [Paenibacillus montanisoli]|uniref:Uncharacterized protein n=1 Tax=Paenibacillus montanisoli TaxID=2081970 RepID=A0A328U3B6_9BACL|nr:hypothetical protein [Paenibacillus montanisoli]RAP75385.1 hypothetical protein DL346_18685 [Paenibacillus montanisoli]